MNNIPQLLSQKRLAKYNASGSNSLKLHTYNVELSETFYPIISYFEIVLRNKINTIFTNYYGKNWILQGTLEFNQAHKVDIDKAKKQLTSAGKKIEHDYLISELNFGFWTRFFTKEYNAKIWDKHENLLQEIFNKTKRNNLSEKRATLNKIRDYRNRIFHYGSIINPNLATNPQRMHSLIKATFKDLDAESVLVELNSIDRFESIYNKGKAYNIFISQAK